MQPNTYTHITDRCGTVGNKQLMRFTDYINTIQQLQNRANFEPETTVSYNNNNEPFGERRRIINLPLHKSLNFSIQ